MSLVVLKRKTAAKKNLSGNSKKQYHQWVNRTNNNHNGALSTGAGFSINGGTRNIGAVNPTNLAKSVKNTQFFGLYAKSSAGTTLASNTNYIDSGSCCFNNSNIIKPSVLSTKGMLSNRLRCMKRGYPHYWVQPQSDKSSSERTENHKTNNLCKTSHTNSVISNCNKGCKDTYIGNKKRLRQTHTKALSNLSRSNSDYITIIKQKCLNPSKAQAPFPFAINNNGCNTFYKYAN